MAVGNDGFSNCNVLCDPENHTKWSCMKYCPDYVYMPILSTRKSTVATVPEKTASSYDGMQWQTILMASAVVFCTAIFVIVLYLLYRRYKKKDFNMIPCFTNRPLTQPIQETNIAHVDSEAHRIVRYENELNDHREQFEALMNQNTFGTVGFSGNAVDRRCVINDLPENISENIPASESLLGQNVQNSSSSNAFGADEAELNENTCGCSIVEDVISAASGNGEKIFNSHMDDTTDTEATTPDNSDDLSDCSITVSEDSSDEDDIYATSGNTRPKRMLRVVTEIQI